MDPLGKAYKPAEQVLPGALGATVPLVLGGSGSARGDKRRVRGFWVEGQGLWGLGFGV